jgi:TolB-like protein/Tfp pilus assembly protein PilF
MSEDSPTLPAVFLSYAREDAEAAARIAGALRGFGIEVWFDQSELRGGDSWDAKIKKQIRECALFVAVVSSNSQRREEGYFRREWLLAVERKRDMAESRSFILPVIVDATKESEANVPEQFLKVHFTRLPGGEPTPQFVDQVKRLLQPSRASGSAPAAHSASAPVRHAAAKWPIFVAIAIVAAGGLWLWLARPSAPSATPTEPKVAEVTAPAAPKVDDKSIAVLPFANMSEDKDAGFFADGVHEDLLTNLALVPELKVVSRTSVMQYRATTKTIRQIGQELGVAYILEGSVRRAGNQVRVTGQLINTRTDEHVWAKNYDRDLTDIFSIQSALSQEIATALSAAISPETKKHLERRPTENAAAYELFLKTRNEYSVAPRGSLPAMKQAEERYKAVVDLDPKFAEAWGELAAIHAHYIFWGKDTTPARLALGEAAIAHARELAPDAPEIIEALGTYAYYAHRDYAAATALYARLAKLEPNNPQMHFSLGLVLRRQGHWAESLVEMRRALTLEPANFPFVSSMAEMLYHLRRWDELRAMRQRIYEMHPTLRNRLWTALNVESSITGTTAAFEAEWARLTPAERAQPVALYFRKQWAYTTRNTAEFRRLDALQPFCEEMEEADGAASDAAYYLYSLGDKAGAAARMAPFVAPLRRQATEEPGNPIAQQAWGFCQLLTGETENGLASLRTAMQLMPTANDAMDGPNYEYSYLEACALLGRNDEVLARLPALLQQPSLFPPATFRLDSGFDGLRDDPRFKAILSDPANLRAPLY